MKFALRRVKEGLENAFNRTLEELKYNMGDMREGLLDAFNRTLEELKFE